ncbi:MAG: non-homologous end-joining DNA ligase [Halanaerobiaceae bacterium]
MQITVNKNKVAVTNLEKILWPETGYCKHDLIDYYIKVYPMIKNYLKNRPLALRMYPDGIHGKNFFLKNCPSSAPDWLSTEKMLASNTGKTINWVLINKLEDLIWVANRASIELHGWFSLLNKPDNPDYAVFDLDPGEKIGFQMVVLAAKTITEILDNLKLVYGVKTSGKTGIHVYIPLDCSLTFSRVRNFLQNIARLLVDHRPDIYTTEWRKKKREGKLYIDYRQNARGKTIPAPYSLRPTPKATVSTPLRDGELTPSLQPDHFTLENILSRLKKFGDPWSSIYGQKQKLPASLL